MDTVEVTLRLDRSLAERLRDPGERARYEAFLQIVSNAASQADIREAARLLTATPKDRQRRLKRAFEEIRRRVEAADVTAEEIEHELTAYKRERCAARPRGR
jgi:transcription elongation GreA/GreB family factor